MFEDYYGFFLLFIFRHPGTTIISIATDTRNPVFMVSEVIGALKTSGFLTADEDKLSMSVRGIRYLEKNDLIPPTDIINDPGRKNKLSATKNYFRIPLFKSSGLFSHREEPLSRNNQHIEKWNRVEIISWIFGIVAVIVAVFLVIVVFGKKPV